MNLAQVFFFVCAAFAVFGAVTSVAAKGPIRGALGLMVLIFAIAGIFISLNAQFLAAIQLIVYAGAVVVLFLFVIMLLGPDATIPSDLRGLGPRVFGGALFALGGAAGIFLAVRGGTKHVAEAPASDFGGVDALSHELFTSGIVPFELSSGLLMIAVLGAVAIARGKQLTPAEAAAAKLAAHEARQAAGETVGPPVARLKGDEA